MAAKKWIIELRTDHDTPEQDNTIRDIGRQLADQWYTSALLIKGKREPDVAYFSDDMFEGREEIQRASE